MIKIGEVKSLELFAGEQILTILLEEGFLWSSIEAGSNVEIVDKGYRVQGLTAWPNGQFLDLKLAKDLDNNVIGEAVFLA